jgi:hypothetical protein
MVTTARGIANLSTDDLAVFAQGKEAGCEKVIKHLFESLDDKQVAELVADFCNGPRESYDGNPRAYQSTMAVQAGLASTLLALPITGAETWIARMIIQPLSRFKFQPIRARLCSRRTRQTPWTGTERKKSEPRT